jgi:hypothetical protein
VLFTYYKYLPPPIPWRASPSTYPSLIQPPLNPDINSDADLRQHGIHRAAEKRSADGPRKVLLFSWEEEKKENHNKPEGNLIIYVW